MPIRINYSVKLAVINQVFEQTKKHLYTFNITNYKANLRRIKKVMTPITN